jgi:hypothetical protein
MPDTSAIRNSELRTADSELESWLSPDAAAEAMGFSERHVRRLLGSGELAGRRDGQGNWRVDPSAHPALRFAAGLPVMSIQSDDSELRTPNCELASVSQSKRAVALKRWGIVRQFNEDLACCGDVGLTEFTRQWVEVYNYQNPGETIAVPTLYRWRKQLAESGVAGLIDGRKAGAAAVVDPEAWEIFAGLYCRQNQPNVKAIYQHVAAMSSREGWTWPSLRTIQTWAQKRLSPKMKLAGREPKKYRDRCIPQIHRDGSLIPAMGLWVADHRQLDVFWPRLVRYAKNEQEFWAWKWERPWLTAFLDYRTWKLVARTLCFDGPNGDRVMGAFAAGISRHGKPEHVYFDNGKDFRMKRLAGGRRKPSKPGEPIVEEKYAESMLGVLGVGVTWAIPYNAKAKVIEPWFRLMADRFDRTFEGIYIGNRHERRPELTKGLEKLHGKAEEFALGRLTADQTRELLYTGKGQQARDAIMLSPLASAFDGWLAQYDLGQSPAEAAGGMSVERAFQSLRDPAFVASCPAEAELALLLVPSVPVQVKPEGIYVKQFGRWYDAEFLNSRRCGSGRDLGRKVTYRALPDDPSHVLVFTVNGEYLGAATPYVGENMHPLAAVKGTADQREQLSAAIEHARHVAKADRQQLSTIQRYAHNALLAHAHIAAEESGQQDTNALTLPTAPQVIKMTPLATAAQDGKAEASKARARSRAAEFFASRAARTGTDDQDRPAAEPVCGKTFNPWDALTRDPQQQEITDYDRHNESPDAPDPA